MKLTLYFLLIMHLLFGIASVCSNPLPQPGPAKPTEPKKAAKPDKVAKPDKPSKPSNPGKPIKPAKPDTYFQALGTSGINSVSSVMSSVNSIPLPISGSAPKANHR